MGPFNSTIVVGRYRRTLLWWEYYFLLKVFIDWILRILNWLPPIWSLLMISSPSDYPIIATAKSLYLLPTASYLFKKVVLTKMSQSQNINQICANLMWWPFHLQDQSTCTKTSYQKPFFYIDKYRYLEVEIVLLRHKIIYKVEGLLVGRAFVRIPITRDRNSRTFNCLKWIHDVSRVIMHEFTWHCLNRGLRVIQCWC